MKILIIDSVQTGKTRKYGFPVWSPTELISYFFIGTLIFNNLQYF